MNTIATAIPLSEISSGPVERLSTAVPCIDWCFGSTTDHRGRMTWGLPARALTLVSGAAGSGKSRLAIKIAAAMTQQYHRVLFAQSEIALTQFKGWVLGQNARKDNFLVTQTVEVELLTDMVSELRPALLVVDSISMLGLTGAAMKRAILALKWSVEDVGAHGLLLAHENARGQVKGGTMLPHLVDVVARIERSDLANWVTFEVGKNRFGSSGRSATFNHSPTGVTPVFVSDSSHPMFQVRIDSQTGMERRQVPEYGTGKLLEVDESGQRLQRARSGLFARLLGH